MPFKSTIPEETKEEARRLYETTKLSVRQIAEQLELTQPTVQTWVRRSGWVRAGISPIKGLQAIAKTKLEQRIANKVEAKAELIASKTAAIQEKMQQEAELTIETLKKAREHVDAKIDAGDVELEDVLKLTGAQKNCFEVNRKLHGLDNDRQTVKVGLFLPVQVLNVGSSEQSNAGAVVEVETEKVTETVEPSVTN